MRVLRSLASLVLLGTGCGRSVPPAPEFPGAPVILISIDTLRARGYATGAAVSTYVLRGATGIDESWDFFDDSVVGDLEVTRDVSLLKRPGAETARRALAWVGTLQARPFHPPRGEDPRLRGRQGGRERVATPSS